MLGTYKPIVYTLGGEGLGGGEGGVGDAGQVVGRGIMVIRLQLTYLCSQLLSNLWHEGVSKHLEGGIHSI